MSNTIQHSNRRRRFIKEFHKQDGKCYWCSEDMIMCWDLPGHISPKKFQHVASREHIRVRSKGGGNNWDNLKIVCHECNDIRSTIPHDAFKWVTSTPERYAKFIAYKAHKDNIQFDLTKKKKAEGKIKGVIMCATMFYMINFTLRSVHPSNIYNNPVLSQQ